MKRLTEEEILKELAFDDPRVTNVPPDIYGFACRIQDALIEKNTPQENPWSYVVVIEKTFSDSVYELRRSKAIKSLHDAEFVKKNWEMNLREGWSVRIVELYTAPQTDRVAELESENKSLWGTLIRLADFLNIDYEKARTHPGKPSDVYIEHIVRNSSLLEAEVKRLREALSRLKGEL